MADALHDGVPEVDLEYRVRRPDGEVRWVRARAVRAGGKGPSASYVGSMVDVTEFKQIEDALRESEARFRAIVEQGFDIVNVLDNDGSGPRTRRLRRNASVATAASGSGRLASDFIHPDDVERVMELLREHRRRPRRCAIPSRSALITATGDVEMLEVVARELVGRPGGRWHRRRRAHRHRSQSRPRPRSARPRRVCATRRRSSR